MRYGALALSVAGLLATGFGALAQSSTALGPSGETGATGRIAPIPQTLPHDANRPAGTLTAARASYPRGSTVVLHFTVKNTTSSMLHYDFSTAQQFDVTVTDPNGVEVWKWSQGRMYAQVLTAIDLRPGESKGYSATWNTSAMRPLMTGTYTATASLTPTVRPAIRGGLLVSPDVDPNNVGQPTRGNAESGAVIQVNVTPGVSASTKFTITP
jgi:hypothetical protein